VFNIQRPLSSEWLSVNASRLKCLIYKDH